MSEPSFSCLHCGKNYQRSSHYIDHLQQVGCDRLADLIFNVPGDNAIPDEGEWIQRHEILREIIEQDDPNCVNMPLRTSIQIRRASMNNRHTGTPYIKPEDVSSPEWVFENKSKLLTNYSRYTDVVDRIWYSPVGGDVQEEQAGASTILNSIPHDVLSDVSVRPEDTTTTDVIYKIKKLFTDGATNQQQVSSLNAARKLLPPNATYSTSYSELPAVEAELTVVE